MSTPTAEFYDPNRPPLLTAAVETEQFVAQSGWDQPVRLFALVETDRLLEAEPQLRQSISSTGPGALSAVEQDGLGDTSSLEALLGRIQWPAEVDGAAIAVERIVVPPEAEQDLPNDPEAAAQALAKHPQRADVRLLVAVTRDGQETCLLRQRLHDADDKVAVGTDIAPGLLAALKETLGPS